MIVIPKTELNGVGEVRREWAKLLYGVDRDAQNGYDFYGSFVKRGDEISESGLRPTDKYPAIPILLECIEYVTPSGRGRTWVNLWQLNPAAKQWTLVVRVRGKNWANQILEEVLERLPVLAVGGVRSETIRSSIESEGSTILTELDVRLAKLDPAGRKQLLAYLRAEIKRRYLKILLSKPK